MRPRIPRRLRRLTPVVLAGFAITGVPAVAVADAPCGSTAGHLTTMTAAAVRTETQCLLNSMRAERGLSALKLDRRLSRACAGPLTRDGRRAVLRARLALRPELHWSHREHRLDEGPSTLARR